MPDAGYPPDGVDLLPVLVADAPLIQRKVFWRYKSNAQRAYRDGDFKYLKIRDDKFLFNVVDDPMERANLKERNKDVFQRMEAAWREWNKAMLPEIDESYVEGFSSDQLADHVGAGKPATTASEPD
jgi:hypothetical protein